MLRRVDAIATGVVRGVRISVRHRRLTLYYSWGMLVTTGLLYCVLLALLWMSIARNVIDPELQIFAYACAFYAGGGFLGWSVQSVFWYSHLASILRQAEAD